MSETEKTQTIEQTAPITADVEQAEPTQEQICEFCAQQINRGIQLENYVRGIEVHPDLVDPIRQFIADTPEIPEGAKSLIQVIPNDGSVKVSGLTFQRNIEDDFLNWWFEKCTEMQQLRHYMQDHRYPVMLTYEDKKRLFIDYAMQEVTGHAERAAHKNIVSASALPLK